MQAEIDLCRSEGIHVYEVPEEFLNEHLRIRTPSDYSKSGMYTSKGFRFRQWTPLTSKFRLILNLFPKPDIIMSRSILISEDLPNQIKFCVLLHEKGHDICSQSECMCRSDSVLSETHACEYTLSTLLQRKLWGLLKTQIEEDTHHHETTTNEGRAVEAIKKSALWRECVNAIDHQSPISS